MLLVKCQVKREFYLLPATFSSIFSWVKKDNHNEHNQAQIQTICGEKYQVKKLLPTDQALETNTFRAHLQVMI